MRTESPDGAGQGLGRAGKAAAHRDFAEAVYAAVAAIPAGRVASYGQIARAGGAPGRARMIGRLLARAAEHRALPWHRVVNAQGRISLHGEAGKEQRLRLEAEGLVFERGAVNLDRYGWRRGDPSPLLD